MKKPYLPQPPMGPAAIGGTSGPVAPQGALMGAGSGPANAGPAGVNKDPEAVMPAPKRPMLVGAAATKQSTHNPENLLPAGAFHKRAR